MFSHPVAGLGKVCILVGIILAVLAFMVRPDQAQALIALAAGVEAFGFFLLLLGVIAQGFLRIERYLAGIPEMKAAFDASEPKLSAKSNPYQRQKAER